MNENLNLNKAKQSSLEEEITEPNESGTNNTTFIESENHLIPKGKAVLIADDDTGSPAMNPPPPLPEMVPEMPPEPGVIV